MKILSTDVSSQVSSSIVSFIMQSVSKIRVTNIHTKSTTSDCGNVISLKKFPEDLLLLSSSNSASLSIWSTLISSIIKECEQ